MRQSDERVAVMDSPVVFELADADGSALATVCIPSETLDVLLRPHLSVFAELQLHGSISLDSEFFTLFPPSTRQGRWCVLVHSVDLAAADGTLNWEQREMECMSALWQPIE